MSARVLRNETGLQMLTLTEGAARFDIQVNIINLTTKDFLLIHVFRDRQPLARRMSWHEASEDFRTHTLCLVLSTSAPGIRKPPMQITGNKAADAFPETLKFHNLRLPASCSTQDHALMPGSLRIETYLQQLPRLFLSSYTFICGLYIQPMLRSKDQEEDIGSENRRANI